MEELQVINNNDSKIMYIGCNDGAEIIFKKYINVKNVKPETQNNIRLKIMDIVLRIIFKFTY